MMVAPRGEGDLGSGGNVPHGAAPNLDGTSGGTQGEPHFTSPDLNRDGDWIRLEEKTADGYSFSVFLNRFRVRRALSRDETVRKEVRRGNRRTREVGGGMCVTEEDVTYETRLRRAYVLDQAYDYYIVDAWLEWWYGIFNSDEATLGSMVAGTVGGEVAGGLTAGSGVIAGGTATVGATIGGALLVGGATFVSITQGMSEWKEASEKHHSGWMPLMWYFERDSLPDDPDPLTVTELVGMHPCGRPITGSAAPAGTGFVFSATPVVDGVDPAPPSATPSVKGAEPEDELPGLPTEEGDVEAEPDAGARADEAPETDVPQMSKPAFEGSGEDLSSPDFAPENDWYRDLDKRGGYHFVVQYVNRYREVADSRFDSRNEEFVPTNRLRTRRTVDDLCQDEVEHDVVTYVQTGTRVDQQFQIWRVDSAEAAEELKKALREKTSGQNYTTPSGIGSNTASTASGHVATSAEITSGLIGSADDVADAAKAAVEAGGKVADAVGSIAGWAGNIIDILGLDEPPVPAGAGWTPVGFYLNGAEVDLEDRRVEWLPEHGPYPCPREMTGGSGGNEAAAVSSVSIRTQPTGLVPSVAATVDATGRGEPSGPGSDHPTWWTFPWSPWVAGGLVAGIAILLFAGYTFFGGGGSSDSTAPSDPPTGGQIEPGGQDEPGGEEQTDAQPDPPVVGPMIYEVAAGSGFVGVSGEQAAEPATGFPMGSDPLDLAGGITDGEVEIDDDMLRVTLAYTLPVGDLDTWRVGFAFVDDIGVTMEGSTGFAGGRRVDGMLTILRPDGAIYSTSIDTMVDDMGATFSVDLSQMIPSGWTARPTGPIRGYGFLDLAPATKSDDAFVRDSAEFGPIDFPDSAFPDDDSRDFISAGDYRRMQYAGSGLSDMAVDCIVDTVSPDEEATAAFRPDALILLAIPCAVRVDFAGSATGSAVSAGASGFVTDGADVVGCVATELATSVTSVEQYAALANPDYAAWPDALVEQYATALEICAPLRPFYEAKFAAFEPYTRDGCVADMTDHVLGTYSWAVFIDDGILDPDPVVRQQIQAAFDAFVSAGYASLECFQAS